MLRNARISKNIFKTVCKVKFFDSPKMIWI